MKIKKILYVNLVLILIGSLLTACGQQGVFFNRKHIESVDFYLISNNVIIKEAKNIKDKETLDAIYKVLKNIRFNKKFSDSAISEGLNEPETYYVLDVNLRKNYGLYSLHISKAGRCFNYKDKGYEYFSLSGDRLLEIIENYFEQQES